MKHFFWIDLEMTGLDEKSDSILEIAAVITDLQLKPLEEFHRIIYQPPQVLEKMNDWCKKAHSESGLISKITTGVSIQEAEKDLIHLLDQYFGSQEKVPLAGNSVSNDQRFILRFMPQFSDRLHYRVIDVSSFKEVFREKYGLSFKKKNSHRALEDIYESIRALEFYLSFVQIQSPSQSEAIL